jgi:anthranilate synthase/aminodeoxychorismate synthase-like glutamine amidotransferase
MLLMIDNYDSFTYNLFQYFGELGEKVKVFRNDKTTVAQIKSLKPDGLTISPGPGRPKQAGISVDAIRYFTGKIPILGVCLGHQSIGEAFGGNIVPAKRIMHGKTSLIYHDNKGIYNDLPNPFEATRYHSLVIEKATLPNCLKVSAETKEGEIMGVRHNEYPIEGIQFHPESILTQEGKRLLNNFLMVMKS